MTQAFRHLRSGDNVFFRPRPVRGWRVFSVSAWKALLLSSAITRVGRSRYSHVGKLVCTRGRWFVAEMVGTSGSGRLKSLRQYLETHSGYVDVFRCDEPGFFAQGSVDAMLEICERRYGFRDLARAYALRLPFARFFVTNFDDDTAVLGESLPYCSAAVAAADQFGGGVDPVSELGVRFTEPGDLARSSVYQYQFTLIADKDTP